MHKVIPVLLVISMVCCYSVHADWVPLQPSSEEMRPVFNMLSHSANGDRFEMQLSGVELTSFTLEGKLWDRVEIPGGGFEQELGKPEVPHVTRLLAIPPSAAVHIEGEILEELIIRDIDLMPAQGISPDETTERYWDEGSYQTDMFFPETLISIGEPAIMRGIRVIPVQMNPIRYNPIKRELRIATRMEINAIYSGTDHRNVPSRTVRPISHSWGKLMRSVVLNFDEMTDVSDNLAGSYLIICENDAQLITAIEEQFVEWKKRMGYTVVLETFSPGTNNSGIKGIIQNAYDNWDTPPEFVLLVGDSNGNYTLPGWSSYVGDHPYAQLDGSDILADVAVGRLPAENITEAMTMLNKVLWYEKEPFTYDDHWFQSGLLVAGSSSSGLSTILTNRWIKTRMIEHDFTRIDTAWYNMGVSITTAIANGLNSGVSIFNYRGYLGMSGWGNSNTNNLTNGYMMPFIVTLTCDTGGFSGNSVMEGFVTAGTPTVGKGAVACVGTATWGTNTRCNNAVDIGVFQGLFNEDITQAGNALVRGKLELYNAYINVNSSNVTSFSKWNNLAGDPGLEIWTGPIQMMQAEIPDTMDFGSNQFDIIVTDNIGAPLEGARICAYKPDDLQVVSITDEDGYAYCLIDPQNPGNVKVTVTKPNYKPILDSLELVQQPTVLGFYSAAIDDDASGESTGDDDGTINPGETVEIPIILRNYGSTITASNVVLTATSSDILISQGDMFEFYGNIPPASTVPSLDDIDFGVSLDAPDGHIILLELTITADQGTWTSAFELEVAAPSLDARGASIVGVDTVFYAGQTADITIVAANFGGDDTGEITAVLRSLDPLITVSDSVGTYSNVEPRTGELNNNDYFTITISPDIPPGWATALELEFTMSSGIVQVDTTYITVGEKSSTDPFGPEEYGYYCYDDTDSDYPPHFTYDWIEIDPDLGGPGTQLPIYDSGEEQDASINIPLPINFSYYGETVDTITVCTNGWISAIPNVAFTDFRNWPIPGAPGPDGMIAPFWDDLTTQGDGRVYAWHDETNHLFVVEWSNMRTLSGSTPETFEVVLYDPDYYPTPTGDGEILFQYADITQVNGYYWDNPYSTIGIESPDQSQGIEVTYSQIYSHPEIAPLQNRRAYFFTTRFEYTPPGSALQTEENAADIGIIPSAFALYTPHPNPFNPSTIISFDLPVASHVKIEIFNVAGRQVSLPLIDGFRDAGSHAVTFDGSGMASGVYIYRLEAGAYIGSGKMVLMK